MRLILIRHGETLWNETHRFQGFSDIELTSRGWSQAHSLAESLKEETIAAIYSSPLIRARQTAECITLSHDCPVFIEEGLKELNQGRLEGLTAEDLRRDYPDFLKQWFQEPGLLKLPQGESLADLQRRAWAVIERIVERHPDDVVVAVAHSFVNLTILCRVLEIPLNHFRRLRQDAAAKNIIEFSERETVLCCLNDTCHLVEPPGQSPAEHEAERRGKRAK